MAPSDIKIDILVFTMSTKIFPVELDKRLRVKFRGYFVKLFAVADCVARLVAHNLPCLDFALGTNFVSKLN